MKKIHFYGFLSLIITVIIIKFYIKNNNFECQFDIKNQFNLCEVNKNFYISKNHDIIFKNIKRNINYTFFDQNPDMQEMCEKIVKGNFDTLYIKISENGNIAIDGCYVNDQFIDIFLLKQFLKTKNIKIY